MTDTTIHAPGPPPTDLGDGTDGPPQRPIEAEPVDEPVAGHLTPRRAVDTLGRLNAAEVQIPRPAPFPTGFSPLDDVLHGGVRAGDLLVLGGKPGQGKTIAALQWARHTAVRGNLALFVCFEHDDVTLMSRLLACELGEVAERRSCDDDVRLEDLRDGLRGVAIGAYPLRDVLDSDELLLEAEERISLYGERLVMARGSGTKTDLAALDELVGRQDGRRAVLFVDYIQKVPVPGAASLAESDRVSAVTEGLKELALSRHVGVVAIAAADQAGLMSRRLRLHHLRGSTALAYEADIVVLLNDKLTTVSKSHVAYDATLVDRFRQYTIFTVEKNRNGSGDVDLEFHRDFLNYRFHPVGGRVIERLWEEGMPGD